MENKKELIKKLEELNYQRNLVIQELRRNNIKPVAEYDINEEYEVMKNKYLNKCGIYRNQFGTYVFKILDILLSNKQLQFNASYAFISTSGVNVSISYSKTTNLKTPFVISKVFNNSGVFEVSAFDTTTWISESEYLEYMQTCPELLRLGEELATLRNKFLKKQTEFAENMLQAVNSRLG